jgi:hypothetical protein
LIIIEFIAPCRVEFEIARSRIVRLVLKIAVIIPKNRFNTCFYIQFLYRVNIIYLEGLFRRFPFIVLAIIRRGVVNTVGGCQVGILPVVEGEILVGESEQPLLVAFKTQLII